MKPSILKKLRSRNLLAALEAENAELEDVKATREADQRANLIKKNVHLQDQIF